MSKKFPKAATQRWLLALSPAHKRIIVPTVQKILKLKGLNTLKKRLIATEYEYVKNHLGIVKPTIDYLISKNPYLDLLYIHSENEGCLFYLKCLDGLIKRLKADNASLTFDTSKSLPFSIHVENRFSYAIK